MHLPIVDVSALFGDDSNARKTAASAMGAAARDFGFLYVTGHQQPPELFDSLLDVTKNFFAQTPEEKMRVYIGNSRNHRGYVPEGEEVFAGGTYDAKEAYDSAIDLPDYVADSPLLGPNQWPDLPGFKQAVTNYYQSTFELGRRLMQGFSLALGGPADAFDHNLTQPPSQLRLIHYPYNPNATDRPGIGAHTDYEMFTMLRSTSTGLEVQDAQDEWIDAPPIPNAYAVNIGDMLELWTDGAFKATRHRVRKVQEERYSFPLFFSLDYHTKVEPRTPGRTPLIAGKHLYAETAKTFQYLRQRLPNDL
jgi:isopenicillin N synthase-like dioxygenase